MLLTDLKVTPNHLERSAYLYIRQSTMKQVLENRESTRRQYALNKRALALGWRSDQITVIDDDLGISGSSSKERKGFQHLVGDVGLGRVGLVMGLEVSRLARNNADWHSLLEICSLTETLILDEDGLYDPCSFNDRLLLGMKGTMSEAELHFIRARMQGGILSKARRGELKMRPPTGYTYDDTGKMVKDPDREVREAIEYLFATFKRKGTAYAVVKHFHDNGLKFPIRIWSGPEKGKIAWKVLTHSRIRQVLHNPRYAGTFVFGETRRKRNHVSGKSYPQKLPQKQWKIVIPEMFEPYISWEQYQKNKKQLAKNAAALGMDRRRSPPRRGNALLQGIVVCGKCGLRMTVSYHLKNGKLVPNYVCCRKGLQTATPRCQFIQGDSIDEMIGNILIEMMTPTSLDVAIAVFEEIRARHEEVVSLHRTRLQRTRQEAELAQRRFLRVIPENRLVADSLESRWNDALRVVQKLEKEMERIIDEYRNSLTEEETKRIQELVENFPKVWNNPSTSSKERKRMIRFLIEDVTLLKTDVINVMIRFKGGSTREFCLPKPLMACERYRASPEVLKLIRKKARTMTDGAIARELNALEMFSGRGLCFTSRKVIYLRKYHSIKGLYDHYRDLGYLTTKEVGERLNVHRNTVARYRNAGLLKYIKYNDIGMYLYEDPGENVPVKWAKRKRTRQKDVA